MKIDWKKEITLPRPRFSRRSLPRLSRPSMPRISRGPSLSMPSGLSMPKAIKRRPGGSGPKTRVKPPKFLADLYADLRDRRLLPLAALLIVAIVAAPILLGKEGGDGETAPAVSSAPPAAPTDSAFTVVPAEAGLRSPGRRLAVRRPLNPFRSPDREASGAGSEQKEIEAIISSAGATGADTGGTPIVTPSPSESSPIEPAPVESGAIEGVPAEPYVPPVAEPAESGSTTTTESKTNVIVQHQVVGYDIDMKTGFVPEKLEEQTEVVPMTKLPDRENPVLLFVGLSKDNNRALFLMTSQVTAYYGAGHCALDKQACQLIELQTGKSASFTYGYGEEATTYKVLLKKIEPVVKTNEDEATEVSTETERRKSKSAEPTPKAPAGEKGEGEGEEGVATPFGAGK